jgi:hypothetical protein
MELPIEPVFSGELFRFGVIDGPCRAIFADIFPMRIVSLATIGTITYDVTVGLLKRNCG